MFTQKVLSAVQDQELRSAAHLDDTDPEQESRLAWVKDDVDRHPLTPSSLIIRKEINVGPDPSNKSLQQSDLLRRFYLAIAINGLKFAYDHAGSLFKPDDLPFLPEVRSISDAGSNQDKHVIVVGAGMSGMVAAYELKREGYHVEILEMSQRYGGRVKTLSQKDGYDRGLHTDGKFCFMEVP